MWFFRQKYAKKKENLTIEDVAHEICEKLIRRHPHIFSDVHAETSEEVAENWEKIKLQGKTS